MNKLLYVLPLSLVLFSSCFELIEEVTFTDKQSGDYLLTVNCSQSRTRLNALMKYDTFMGINIPGTTEISIYLNNAKNAIKTLDGISLVKSTRDYENYIFTFSFHFSSPEALNKAINAAARSATSKDILPYYHVFGLNDSNFYRFNTPNDSLAEIAKNDTQYLKLFTGAMATSIYRFEKTVKKASNAKALISKNKKAVMLKQEIPEIITNPSLFSNTISLNQ